MDKWYNKEKTRMINLDMVSQFQYRESEELLNLTVDSHLVSLTGDNAHEVYARLTQNTNKQ